MTTPYTYLLHHIPTNMFYYGVRYKEGCHPEDFWKNYFTSSNVVKSLRKEYGDDSFEFEIRKTFKDAKDSIEWEHKVLRRLKIRETNNVWLNKHDGRAVIFTEEVKSNISKTRTGQHVGEKNPMYGRKRPDTVEFNKRPDIIEKRRQKALTNNPMKGTKWSEERKRKMSERMSGVNNPMHGKIRPEVGENNKKYKTKRNIENVNTY